MMEIETPKKDRKLLLLDCFGLFAGDPFVTYFNRHFGKDSAPLKDYYVVPADKGGIGLEEVLSNMKEGLGLEPNEVKKELLEIGKPNLEMIEWALKMKERHHVALLSNCMFGMQEHLFKGTAFFDCFDRLYRSCELGIVKPDDEIYLLAYNEYKDRVDEMLFLDDSPRNLPPAEKLGIKTILFDTLENTKPLVEELGY